MNITQIQQNNQNFKAFHAPKYLKRAYSAPPLLSSKLLENPGVKECAEKFDVYIGCHRNCLGESQYTIQGVKKCKRQVIATPRHQVPLYSSNICEIPNIANEIKTQLREIMMLAVANNYPKDSVFKASDILKILKTKEVSDNFTIDEAFDCSIEQNGNATLLTKFFEINPNEDNERDYNKVISILKSNPGINYNQKGVLDISVLENILNFENSKGLDLVMDTEFEYTKELDRLFHNIKDENFRKKALGLKIKFPNMQQIFQQGISKELFAFLDSPFCDSKNTAVSLWMDNYSSRAVKEMHSILYKYLPEYFRKKIPHQSYFRSNMNSNSDNFFAPKNLELIDGTIPSRILLENPDIAECTNEYIVTVERGAQNGVRKKKVERFLPFLSPKTVEEPVYEYILKGIKKGRDNLETQEHLILLSKGVERYITGLVEELRAKDKERFIEIVSKKHLSDASDILELLESDEIKGNYTIKEALTNSIDKNGNVTLLTKFFELKEADENSADYDKLVSIIRSTPNIDFKKNSILEKLLILENPKALSLLMDTEFEHSPNIDKIFNNIKDENFKQLALQLKIKFPDALQILKTDWDIRYYGQKAFSYLESPFCDSPKEAIRLWTELKTRFDTETCLKINAMLYNYLPDNLRID